MIYLKLSWGATANQRLLNRWLKTEVRVGGLRVPAREWPSVAGELFSGGGRAKGGPFQETGRRIRCRRTPLVRLS